MSKGKILIVEDDEDIVEMLAYNLKKEGYKVVSALNGTDAIFFARREKPDLIILDIMLPDIDGLEVCKKLKSNEVLEKIPIIMLTAKSQETDKVIGLEMGADDYVTKPFSPRELAARIKVILRRQNAPLPKSKIEIANLVIDGLRHSVTVSGKQVSLTPTEFRLLEYIAKHPGIVLSRDKILDSVFGYDSEVYSRTIDTHIKSLRKKLGKAKNYIETVRGVGYRFKEIDI